MKKIVSFSTVFMFLLLTVGCTQTKEDIDKEENHAVVENSKLQIVVESEDHSDIIVQLNESKAAISLYEQLPLTVDVENFSDNEKIFYPDTKLDTSDAALAEISSGTLAYYEPWGDVILFYGDGDVSDGVYSLGEAVSGADQIEHLSGQIHVRKLSETSFQKAASSGSDTKNNTTKESETVNKIKISVGNQSFLASLYDNETVRAFLDRLPLTLPMDELHGNEKYYYFSDGFPTNTEAVSYIHSGDFKLFGSDCLVLFYKDFSTSYSYTSLGQIDDPQGLAKALGSGRVSVHFEAVD